MDIHGKTVLVLGAWGLVGNAVTRKLIDEKPEKIIVTSLRKIEIEEEIERLYKEHSHVPEGYFIPWWGNIFVRNEFKDIDRFELLNDPAKRKVLISDIME